MKGVGSRAISYFLLPTSYFLLHHSPLPPSMKPWFSLLLLLLTLGGATAVAAQEETPSPTPAPTLDWRFGVVESYEAPLDATEVGAAWTRIRFQWADVQPNSPDEWNPRVSDGRIERELAQGRDLVGLLIGIPDWARDENGLPRGLYLPPDDPQNLWAVFVGQAVGRYEGRINHWVIWNEPDIWDKNTPGHTWDGSVADFAQLQKVAYRVTRAANPNASVHLAAFTYFWDAQYGRPQYMGLLLDELLADPQAEAYNHYFDVATAHLYFQPDMIYNVLGVFRGMMSERGLDKPIWLVETNAPPHDDSTWPVPNYTFRVSTGEQAAFMPQLLAVALAAGAERIAIYKMKDLEGDRAANPEPFGLLRGDNSRRPAFNALKVATRYMAGVQTAERLRWNEVGIVQLNQIEQTTTVLFARLPAGQVAEVAATAETAVLVDLWGNRRTIRPTNGVFVVELAGALCLQTAGDYCMIGGQPVYLIQSAEGLPTATATPTLAPLPSITPTPSPTLPPTATATPTATAVPSLTPTLTPSPTATPPATATPTATPTATAVPTGTPPAAVVASSGGLSGMAWLLLGAGGLLLLGMAAWWRARMK